MDKLSVNNQIVSVRGKVKKARCQTINKIVRNIRQLKQKNGSEVEKKKISSKVDRLVAELEQIKKINLDEFTKYALLKLHSEETKPKIQSDARSKALNRLSEHKELKNIADKFVEEHSEAVKRLPHLFNLWEIQPKKKKKSRKKKEPPSKATNNPTESSSKDEAEPKESVAKKAEVLKESKKIEPIVKIECSEVSCSDQSIPNNEITDDKSESSEPLSNDESVHNQLPSSSDEMEEDDDEDDEIQSTSVIKTDINEEKIEKGAQQIFKKSSVMEIMQLDLDELSDNEVVVGSSKVPHENGSSAKNKVKKSSFFINSDDDGDGASSEDESKKTETVFVGNRRQRRQQAFCRSDQYFHTKKPVTSKFENKEEPKQRDVASRGMTPRGRGGFKNRFERGRPGPKDSWNKTEDNPNFVKPEKTTGFREFQPKNNPSYPKTMPKQDTSEEQLHPSWAAKRKQKEMLTNIHQFQGSKIKFD